MSLSGVPLDMNLLVFIQMFKSVFLLLLFPSKVVTSQYLTNKKGPFHARTDYSAQNRPELFVFFSLPLNGPL